MYKTGGTDEIKPLSEMTHVKFILTFLVVQLHWNTCHSGNYASSLRFKYLIRPPVAEQVPRMFEIHGRTFIDEYAWMRDKNWPNVTDNKILDYIKAENEYAEKFPLHTEYKEVYDSYYKTGSDYEGIHTKIDDWFYYKNYKHKSGKQYPIHCRKFNHTNATEQIILDENVVAQGHEHVNIEAVTVSPDHTYLAYAVDYVGYEKYVIKIVDMTKNSHLSDEIRDVSPSIAWHGKIPGFFYITMNEYMRPDKVFFHFLHKAGTSGQRDKFVFGEPNNIYELSAEKSDSGKYIFINSSNWNTNEIYVLDITTDTEDFKPVLIREASANVSYEVVHAGDKFYVRTNLGAENYKVIAAPGNEPSNWDNIFVPEEGDYLKKIEATEKYLILHYMKEGVPHIKVKRLFDGVVKSIAFSDASYNAGCITNYPLNEISIFCSALHRRGSLFNFDFDATEVPDFKLPDIKDYVVEFIRVPTSGLDGEEIVNIPVTICYAKSLFKGNGANPAYIEGYGAFGSHNEPDFSEKAMTLIKKGFVYAIAHVRGGGELGTRWHKSAKFLNKKRTFRDFIAVAEGLIKKKYTSVGNIVAFGGSAGGILVGAVMNERPDLFKAVVARFPFADTLNSLLDESVPVTHPVRTELGNPCNDVEYFEYIKSYSPYENVKPQKYPNILVINAFNDNRVGYWMAAKWVARLRRMKTDGNVLLMKTNMHAGHFYFHSGQFDFWKDIAYEVAFILKIFNV